MVGAKALTLGFVFTATVGLAQTPAPATQPKPGMPAKPAMAKPAMAETAMTTAEKIASAKSAAPHSISAQATIMELPDMAGGEPKTLLKGTNEWICYPTMSHAAKGKADPMCIDKAWQEWVSAYMGKTTPKISVSGIAYMLRGDLGASNTDPYAESKTADNHWVVSPPHIMVVYSDPKSLDGFSDDPKSGGPWVMWKGTPYAHLMVPVSATMAAH